MTTASKNRGLLFILVGPSGVGKNTIMNAVLARTDDLTQLPTATTRGIRDDEQEGREHLFVSRERFTEMIHDGDLIEWQVVHDQLYGVPRTVVDTAVAAGRDMIADIEVLGALHLRAVYPDNVILVFVAPPTIDLLRDRLKKREESPQEINKRLLRVEFEMPYAPLCDYLIVNEENNIEAAIGKLRSIIIAERSRRDVIALRAERGILGEEMSFRISVIPVFGGDVLISATPPRLLTGELQDGELPFEGALRLLRREFAFEPNRSNLSHSTILISDDVLESELVSSHTDDETVVPVNFIYLYHLTDRIPSPENWRWFAHEEINFPDAIRQSFVVSVSES